MKNYIALKEEYITIRNAYEKCTNPTGKIVSKEIMDEVKEELERMEFDKRMEVR